MEQDQQKQTLEESSRPEAIIRRNTSPRRWTHLSSFSARASAVVDFPAAITPVIR